MNGDIWDKWYNTGLINTNEIVNVNIRGNRNDLNVFDYLLVLMSSFDDTNKKLSCIYFTILTRVN
jgi:hypothetical protein